MIPRLAATLSTVALVAASCASQSAALPADVQVTIDLKEYAVAVPPASLSAAIIKFGIRNFGAIEHEVEIIKTDLAIDKLPVDAATAKAKEDGLVKQLKNIAPGKVTTLSADLQKGHYVVICNVAGHYQLGMRAGLNVD